MGTADSWMNTQVFANTGGDLWFHIKADSQAAAQKAHQLIQGRLQRITAKQPLIVPAEKRQKGKVQGGRFTDGLENPADAEDLSKRVVIGENGTDDAHRGAAFLVTQKFVHDWTKLNAMSELQKENMLTRSRGTGPMEDESSHKASASTDNERINSRLVRQAPPTGTSDNKVTKRASSLPGMRRPLMF
jgi:deferrochelatase/peroxidase EfeB